MTTKREIVTCAIATVIDALGLEIEPIRVAELVMASMKEQCKLGRYGDKQQHLEDFLTRRHMTHQDEAEG